MSTTKIVENEYKLRKYRGACYKYANSTTQCAGSYHLPGLYETDTAFNTEVAASGSKYAWKGGPFPSVQLSGSVKLNRLT